jgi:hypothetical protein
MSGNVNALQVEMLDDESMQAVMEVVTGLNFGKEPYEGRKAS